MRAIDIVVVVDCGTMMMIAACMVSRCVHMKRERVCLQRADRDGDDGSGERAHVPSLLEPQGRVNEEAA